MEHARIGGNHKGSGGDVGLDGARKTMRGLFRVLLSDSIANFLDEFKEAKHIET
jgi:hypothetical protein